jgi:hypothetical protein
MDVSIQDMMVSVPGDWQLASVVFVGSVEQAASGKSKQQRDVAFSPNAVLSVDTLEPGTTLRGFVQRTIDAMIRAKAIDPQSPAPQETELRGMTEAIRLETVVRGPGGVRIRQIHVYGARDGKVISMVVSHLDGELFEQQRTTLEGIAASLGSR